MGVSAHSDGLAALAEQHHVFPVFTVQPMGDASYCEETAMTLFEGHLQLPGAIFMLVPGEWMGKLFSVTLLVHRLLSSGPEELVMDT